MHDNNPALYIEGECPVCFSEMQFIGQQDINRNIREIWFCNKCDEVWIIDYLLNNEEQKVTIKNLYEIQSKMIRNEIAK